MNSTQNRILGTLSNRLSLAMVVVVVCVGIGILVISQSLMRVYFEEFNQKLNFDIAMYITDEYQLMKTDQHEADLDVIKKLADTAMTVNPAIEVFVLDTDGKVIGHNFPPQTIIHNQVPLAPIRAFIAGAENFPLRNIDPRLDNAHKVFSAAEIRSEHGLQGYLYVILSGGIYDSLEDNLQTSYSRTQAVVATVLIVLAAAISGWLIFRMMVRPLNRLSARMANFRVDNPGTEESKANGEGHPSRDEVTLLTRRFDEMSDKIGQQFEQLREADRLKRELISNVSHDLRTPLASIQGYLETLIIKNDRLTGDERMGYLDTAMKSSRRLGQLIGDLFELSKLDSGQVHPHMEQFSLAELVHDIVQEFGLELERKQIRVAVRNEPGNAAQVFADIGMIQRVFENLIRNAIAHTPEGGEIVLSIEKPGGNIEKRLKITLSDTGQGISPEDLPHIFERFYRNPDRSTQASDSTGLGLAIVKRILELHGTQIAVDSQPNQGTRFEFTLAQQAA